MMDYENLLTPKLIWNIRQNKPSLIARDFEEFGIDKDTTHKILLARGVYKWLSVRRQLITLKNDWKNEIIKTIESIKAAKTIKDNAYQIGYLRGYLKAYENCRADVRGLCHSDRWQAPDFDKESVYFLERIWEGQK